MYRIYSLLATIGPIGHVPKGGGSIAAVFASLCWYFFMNDDFIVQTCATIIVFFVGVWVSNNLEKHWGKDSNKIVIDEVLGMMVSLLFLPISVEVVVVGFILFRFFDITKVLGIRKTEALSKGWGVMVDDLLAGIFSNVILQALFYLDFL
ncbi:phosphatidylglycerophosphatase A [Chryseobacterium sp. Ch-15]|uniref:Phosphatidylglycerophosphatase A n=1 Tax=Chryseobacterium muglaense TaxID=2893752 RepID=A0A9Q3YSL2_9FLAO|nr:phosphatidylglycerophosphatase A [Chryseobacterium muglaense]MBD3903311.1 phosphatidylglycerophosphatase A [Chryseobacterium muglaense]MCC9036141.1 phosphatidylglycerophosphatase A [Chryseobacterium muglaense]MCM2553284.1 phosphatidylglycerophosphatase A [Chryseobacterium muglaense]